MNYIDKILEELKEKHNCSFKGEPKRVAIDKWGKKDVDSFWEDIKQSLLILQEQHEKELEAQKAKLVKEIEQGIDKYFNDGVEKTVFKQKILNKYK